MGADADLQAVEKLAEERLQAKTKTTDEKTKTSDQKMDDMTSKMDDMVQAMMTSNQAMMASNQAQNQANQAQMMASIQAQNQAMMTAFSQILQITHTEQKNIPTTEPKTQTELNTSVITETNTKTNTETNRTDSDCTELERMGVLPSLHRSDKINAHSIPKTALFTELENASVLEYTDLHQYTDSHLCRTIDHFSLYNYYKTNDQGRVIEQLESLHEEGLTAPTYIAKIGMIRESLKLFGQPKDHTRMMVILRALIFSVDPTTQMRTAKTIKAYLATEDNALKALSAHVVKHGSPPAVPEAVITLQGTPGAERLSPMDNPVHFTKCLESMFELVVECNSRLYAQGLNTTDADAEYNNTKPGSGYASTSVAEENAWTKLCQVYGPGSQPKTDYRRIKFLIKLCKQYQGHDKTERSLLKALRGMGKTITNVPFSVAEPIMEIHATQEDDLNAQMCKPCTPKQESAKPANVNTVGAGDACKVCAQTGHGARDCLQFMKSEGVCGHWFMHSIGKYKTGCSYGDKCNKLHARPNKEPGDGATRTRTVAANATTAGQGLITPVIKELARQDLTGLTTTLVPNKGTFWLNDSKIWLQPQTDEQSPCTNCGDRHSLIAPCKSGGGHHSILYTTMESDLNTSGIDKDRPFKWVSYKTQIGADANVTGTRVDVNATSGQLYLQTDPMQRRRNVFTGYAGVRPDSVLYDSDDSEVGAESGE